MQSNFNSFLAIIFDNFIREWEANYNIKLKCTKICTNMHIVYITNIYLASSVVDTPHLEVDLKALLKITSFNV